MNVDDISCTVPKTEPSREFETGTDQEPNGGTGTRIRIGGEPLPLVGRSRSLLGVILGRCWILLQAG